MAPGQCPGCFRLNCPDPKADCDKAPILLIRGADGYDPTVLSGFNEDIPGGISSTLLDALTKQTPLKGAPKVLGGSDALYNGGADGWEDAAKDIKKDCPLLINIYKRFPGAREVILNHLRDFLFFQSKDEFEQNFVTNAITSCEKFSDDNSKANKPTSIMEKLEKEHPRVALLQALAKGVVERKAFTFEEAHETVYDPDESKFLVKLKQNTTEVKSQVHMLKVFHLFVRVVRRIGGLGDPDLWEKFFDQIASNMDNVGGAKASVELAQALLDHMDKDPVAYTVGNFITSGLGGTEFTQACSKALSTKPRGGKAGIEGPDDSGGDDKGEDGKKKKPPKPAGDDCDADVTIDKGAAVRYGKTSGKVSYCNQWNKGESCLGLKQGCTKGKNAGWCSFSHRCSKCGKADHTRADAKC